MKTIPLSGKILGALLLSGITVLAVGNRSGGNADILYESVNNGGVSFATNANVKFGATLGQNGLILVTTNTGVQIQNGFWKGEDGCEFYPTDFSDLTQTTGQVAMTFNTLASNIYTVLSIAHEQDGGVKGGLSVWTNIVVSFTGEGVLGSQTTVFHNVSSLTNVATFYRVICD